MPPMRMSGPPRKAKDAKGTLLRLLGYLKKYIGILLIVMVCIVAGAVAQTVSSTALGNLVDDFILPMVESGSADFNPLWNFILKLICVFLVGMAASFFQS